MRAPRSTYRFQLTPEFTLWDAARLVPYLSRLGADWVYLSPVLQAEEGSQHGYDVTDHSRIDESRGGPDGLRALSDAAHGAGMGVLVDIVPNHVGVATPSANPWWWDLLTHGQGSRYAEAFDVDWEAGGGRIRIPVLGDDSLDALRIEPDGPGGASVLAYYDHHFPIAPGTADDGADARTVHARQHYELMNWRRESAELNYRRFFAVSSLAAIRVEEPWVFDESHAEIGRWFREGLVDGLRVDHPDGLADPGGYLERLAVLTGGAYVLIEKILEGDEPLEPDWPSAGTTGYDALAGIDRVFVDPAGELGLTGLAAALDQTPFDLPAGDPGNEPAAADRDDVADTRARHAWHTLIHGTKRGIADGILRAEVLRLARDIERAGGLPTPTDDTVVADALAELLACFAVYRSYLPNGREHLDHALALARDNRPDLDAVLVETAEVLGRTGTAPSIRFQQTSGMVMAKGVEDTAFYRFTRLTSLTEVGADPDQFSLGTEEFHAAQRRRLDGMPDSMTTLSTHDTKRSEDVRARISVLAEIPDGWAGTLSKLRSLLPLGDGSFENLLWQALLGAWPLSRERAQAYALKAVREAGVSTNWLDPDEEFEQRMANAIDAVYTDPIPRGVLESQLASIRAAGWSNALSAKLVQLTTTGVPDVYQGSELWDLSLVDPDNRRPVDYDERSELLGIQEAGELPEVDETGAAKLLVVSTALRVRRDRPELFTGYQGLEARGSAAEHVLAFDRGGAVTVATRLPLGLARHGGWDDTTLELPEAGNGYVDAFTGRIFGDREVRLAAVLERYPVALLERIDER
ncbi:malto-oligosyltrehalose synthase [Herbiconiux ginsengi]|uniref:Maltooligosyl trehalose synthase n=1 Tax=Herbiconiux ginsengi TaxID=381665 RepID=A0A1H3RU13_9MICO|nr:malto-oligosyltrehalose synthase [Herbiconiux ginsengi]SDZ29177.1 maltooligosyl trehalose synthase [Herbiconiux ginsengi]